MSSIDEIREQSKQLLSGIVNTSIFDGITEDATDITITLGIRQGRYVSLLSAEKKVEYTFSDVRIMSNVEESDN